MLFARCLAILLLFSAPAYATVQRIVGEHLPTVDGQAQNDAEYDEVGTVKPILRSQMDKTVFPFADSDSDDDTMMVSGGVAAASLGAAPATIAFFVADLPYTLDTLARKRAPPHDKPLFYRVSEPNKWYPLILETL